MTDKNAIFYQNNADNNHQNKLPISTLDSNQLPASGRITITGKNNADKSRFLLQLKEQFNDAAQYLPAKHTLLFLSTQKSMSTGQALQSQL